MERQRSGESPPFLFSSLCLVLFQFWKHSLGSLCGFSIMLFFETDEISEIIYVQPTVLILIPWISLKISFPVSFPTEVIVQEQGIDQMQTAGVVQWSRQDSGGWTVSTKRHHSPCTHGRGARGQLFIIRWGNPVPLFFREARVGPQDSGSWFLFRNI